jgi:cytochrome c-type biogenesis protein CcmH
MTLWIVLASLCLIALAFVVLPLYRSSGRLSQLLVTIIVFVVASSALLYNKIGQPGAPSGAGAMADSSEVVESLAARLKDNPGDVDGWVLLGRSYQSMQQYDEAIAAFEKALELEQGQNARTMVSLGIALMESRGGQPTDRSTRLFENALSLEPNDSNALFYAGGAAASRGDTALAADRWETLLGMNAPPEIQELLRRKIAEWRGHPPIPAGMAQAQPPQPTPGNAIVALSLSLSDDALAELPADATLYVIARDPAQPSPPIAVSPRRLSELPVIVELSDTNSMVAGRPLSGFTRFEVVARVSLSGSPAAQSGDWSGSLIVEANSGQTVDLVIDQKIP